MQRTVGCPVHWGVFSVQCTWDSISALEEIMSALGKIRSALGAFIALEGHHERIGEYHYFHVEQLQCIDGIPHTNHDDPPMHS